MGTPYTFAAYHDILYFSATLHQCRCTELVAGVMVVQWYQMIADDINTGTGSPNRKYITGPEIIYIFLLAMV